MDENITFIIGEAGTSKTTSLMKLVDKFIANGNTFMCLAFTHSAVNNMYQTFIKNHQYRADKRLFRTIHSYFKIAPDNVIQSFNRQRIDPEYILIDEFSLIPLDIVNLIFETSTNKLILAGDLLQLNPVDTNKHLNIVNPKRFKKFNIQCDLYTSLLVTQHLSNNIFITPQYENCKKIVLTENFRSGTDVIKLLNDVLSGKDFEILHYKSPILREYVEKNNPTFISSQYKYLAKLYEEFVDPTQFTTHLNTKLGQTFYNSDKKFVLTKNVSKNIYNGDIVRIVEPGVFKYGEEVFKLNPENGQYPVLPTDYISIHKSQGRSYDNIVVILDQLFEITMLYTAITRARKQVKFVLIDYDLSKFKEEFNESIKAFNLLRSIIYV